MEAEREQIEVRLEAVRALVDGLGRGEALESSNALPPSFAKAEPALVELGATARVLSAERRIWALLDDVSWSSATREAVSRGFVAMRSDPERARRVGDRLDVILRAVECGATASELVPLVEELVGEFPPRRESLPSGTVEQQTMSALAMHSLPPAIAEALRLVAQRERG